MSAASPHVLFASSVRRVRRLSPRFVRLTLGGPQLATIVPRGLDQRVKVLVPGPGYPASLHGGLDEPTWRRRWRAVAEAGRPALRSYTISAARPEDREVDVDVFLHTPAGPASRWAAQARPGEEVLLSAPDVRRDPGSHGVQWRPGPARSVLLAGDETAYPAIRGIVRGLGPARATVLLEAGDPRDAAWLLDDLAGIPTTLVPGGGLVAAVRAWAAEHAGVAAAAGPGWYGWLATETTRVAGAREVLLDAGLAPDRVHAQGYWHDRPRRTHSS